MNTKYDLAVMLYVPSQEEGDSFYEAYLKPHLFPRFKYTNSKHYTDYHISTGFVSHVDEEDIQPLKEHLTDNLTKQITLPNVSFEYGALSLFGHPSHPIIVAFPKNIHDFLHYNELTQRALASFKSGLYKLEHKSNPHNYIPHLNLYAKLHRDFKIADLPTLLPNAHQSLQGIKMPLTQFRIDDFESRRH